MGLRAAVIDFHDLAAVVRLEERLEQLGPAAAPRGVVVRAPAAPQLRRLGALPGSFNPLTRAHLALAHAARRAYGLDAIVFVLSRRTINKEVVSGASLADRLLVLQEQCRAEPWLGVVATNRGLYVEHAAVLRELFPQVEWLAFLVGYDKIVQILDPRYYQDRDAALRELCALASLLVAPREEGELEDVERLMARPENTPFCACVRPLDLPADCRRLASSLARSALQQGQPAGDDLPPATRRFIAATRCYQPPLRLPSGDVVDVYALRQALAASLRRAGTCLAPASTEPHSGTAQAVGGPDAERADP